MTIIDIAQAAESYGLGTIPEGFGRMKESEQTRIATEIIDAAREKAAGGDRTATDFFEVFNRSQPVPTAGIETFTPIDRETRFVGTDELVADTHRLIETLPHISAVAAMPRSGFFPASIIAMRLHVPMYHVRSHDDGWIGSGNRTTLEPISHGMRLQVRSEYSGPVLIVDDTVGRGGTVSAVRSSLDTGGVSTAYAAVYVHPNSTHLVDYHVGVLREPHLLEWNFANSPFAAHCGTDMDGIICDDFAQYEDDDGEQYIEAMRCRRPRHLFRRGVRAIVTSRLEKYRRQTVAWLEQHGVRYDSLIMGPWRTQAERAVADVAGWKAEQCRNHGVAAYFESDRATAEQMAGRSGCPVCCPESRRIYWGTE